MKERPKRQQKRSMKIRAKKSAKEKQNLENFIWSKKREDKHNKN